MKQSFGLFAETTRHQKHSLQRLMGVQNGQKEQGQQVQLFWVNAPPPPQNFAMKNYVNLTGGHRN